MNNNPTYQQPLCTSCATSVESNTETTRQRDGNETITTANDTVRLVPELRFPEFQNAGAWGGKKIGDISFSFSGGTPPVANREYYGGEIPFIRSGEIGSGSTKLYLSQNGIKSSAAKIVDKGTLLYALYGATSGEVAISKIRGAINQAVLAIIPNDYMSVSFIYQYLSANKSRIVNQYIQGGQGNLSGTIINSLVIPIPSLLEQQKIADCMQSVDEYIAATNQKLEQLKIYKKALLQKLFPQRGKTMPELRFPEFQDAEPWEEKKIGEIIVVHSGRDYKHLNFGNIPVYGTGGYMLSVDDYLSDIDAVGIGRKGTIDKPQYLKAPFWTVDTLFYMTTNEGYDVKFIYYLSQTIAWKKYGEQTGVPSLSKVSIENLEIIVPTNITEQKRIVDVFSSIDDNIDNYSKKIIELLQHKKWLTQNLFP